MLKNIRRKKGFTLIELILVMVMIGILVLLAMPKFMGHTKEAKLTKFISNTKQLENASERYYVANQDWPRLRDVPYTSAQITAFSQKVYDTTGKEVILDPTGNYYDIDYSKLGTYIHVPDDKLSYVIQNPVGNVYALESLTAEAQVRTLNNKPTAIITMTPNSAISTTTNMVWGYSDSTDPDNDKIINAEWNGKLDTYTPGDHTVKLRVQDERNMWSDWVQITFNVVSPFTSKTYSYTGNYETLVVPVAGTYKLEVWGAQGGTAGGKGGYTTGNISLNVNQTLYVYIGSTAGYNQLSSGGGNSGDGTVGGGGTDVKINGQALSNRIIAAGGGGGGDYYTIGYAQHGYGGAGGGLTGVQGQSLSISGLTAVGGAGGTVGGNKGGNGQIKSPTLENGLAFSGGGGGSGYIGGVTSGSMTNGLKVGNGSATITYVGP